MKKGICLLLALILLLSLCACSSADSEYQYILDMLEQGDYDGAITAIQQIKLENGGGLVLDGVIIGGIQGDPQGPTEEEQNLIQEYVEIYRFLHAEGDSIFVEEVWISGQEALRYCYETLPKLEGVKKWADKQYVEIYDVAIWDPQALLAGFTVLDDAPQKVTQTKEDNLHNIKKSTLTEWQYDSDGRMNYSYGEVNIKPFIYGSLGGASTGFNNWDKHYYTYDESGRLTQKTKGKDPVDAVYTYTYDDAGRIAKEHCKTNSGEQNYAYSYDSAGRLSKISWKTDDLRYSIDYTYDAAGRLTREAKTTITNIYWSDQTIWDTDYKIIMDYVYDESGRLVSASLAKQDWQVGEYRYATILYSESVDRYTYTYDDQGRLRKVEIIPGNTVAQYYDDTVLDTPDYISKTWEYAYGYYIYTPVQ